jgi:hypothetical protein
MGVRQHIRVNPESKNTVLLCHSLDIVYIDMSKPPMPQSKVQSASTSWLSLMLLSAGLRWVDNTQKRAGEHSV